MNEYSFLNQRIELGRLDTPIQKLERLSEEYGAELYIKRDDLTGSGLSGNKVRKLEYLLFQAEKEGADTVLTGGGPQSNHSRATAVACRMRGLNPVLVLLKPRPEKDCGNLFLDRMLDADLRFVASNDFWQQSGSIMEEIAKSLRKDEGRKPYVIPLGGSNSIGLMGYIRAGMEIQRQEEEMGVRFDHIICAAGTGGTVAGLALNSVLNDWNRDIIGINVTLRAEYFNQHIKIIMMQFLAEQAIQAKNLENRFRIVDGFVGPGYGISTPKEIQLMLNLARTEGVFLDPVYTGKAFWGMEAMLNDGRIKKGAKILFIHTGGIYGLLADSQDILKMMD